MGLVKILIQKLQDTFIYEKHFFLVITNDFWSILGSKIAIFQFLTLFEKFTIFFTNLNLKKKKKRRTRANLRLLIFSGGDFFTKFYFGPGSPKNRFSGFFRNFYDKIGRKPGNQWRVRRPEVTDFPATLLPFRFA